jgi:hypothetical protein
MIGIENKDSSFFTIESTDVKLNNKSYEKNLISLSITERTGTMAQGTLSFYDPDHWFSKILRTGVEIKLSWGYKKIGVTPDSLIAKKLNLDEITGSLIRRGLRGFVSSPKGKGDNKGVITYDCKFTSYGFRGTDQVKLYTFGQKKDVIADAFNDLGITKKIISFSLGNDFLKKDTGIRQAEPTFRFLNRLAMKWRCLFHVGYSQIGEVVGIFVDANKIGDPQYATIFLSAVGLSNVIGYMGELNNVKSYTWSSSESESGVGDNVRLDIIDGQIVFRRFIAETEKTVTYRLDIDKIKKVYTDVDDLGSQIALIIELLSKQTFQQVEHFFIPITHPTAPQGYGYRINVDMIGNPLFSPPNEVKVNNGFPYRILYSNNKLNKFYVQSVTHTINRSGYNMNAEIVDVFTLSPIGVAIK